MAKKGLQRLLFAFQGTYWIGQARISINPWSIGRFSNRITATIPGPFLFISGVAGRIMISIFLLMITFSVLLQCGHRMENRPSELKTASLKMMLVQWGQFPRLVGSSAAIVLFRRLWCYPDKLLVLCRQRREPRLRKGEIAFTISLSGSAAEILDHG